MSLANFVKNAIALGVARFSRDTNGNFNGLISPNGLFMLLGVRQNPTAAGIQLNDDINSPLEIANCELWLDATNGPAKSNWTELIDGEAISTWQDSSGNARHATIAAGTPLYKTTGGYGGQPGVKIGAGCRMVTPAFVTNAYGNALTLFIVSKEDAVLHSSLKIKASISTASFWIGNTGTTGNRDTTISGLTGYGGVSGATPYLGGIDMISVGASKVRVLTNGIGLGASGSVSSGDIAISSGSVPFTNGALTIGGLAGSSTYDWPGVISEVILFNRELTSAEQRKVFRYLSNKYDSAKRLVAIGDSLTSGQGSTGGANQSLSSSGNNFPSLLLASYDGAVTITTDAYGGRTVPQVISGTPEYSGLYADGKNAINLIWIGTNTLASTKSPSYTFNLIRQACLLKKGLGKKVIICTTIVRGDSGDNAKNLALTTALNNLIKANYRDFVDDIVDLAADARLQNTANTTYFAADTIHLTDAGYVAVAELVKPVVDKYI